ncbi:MAG: glycoside hydrolase family 27 protein [Massiliimalia sp.]|jgi:alpha-galactosidase
MRKKLSAPPMGWNSFDCFGWSVTEEEFIENVNYMAEHLADYGWEYAVVDFCWYTPGKNSEPNPNQNDQFIPYLNMDEYGRLIPDPVRFPSSADGKGFKPLADYVHSKGLKFGIHIMRGIPKQAAAKKTQIKGTSFTADSVADTEDICPWLNYMYGVDMTKEGSQEYLDSLFELYDEWNVDFVKIDDLSYPYHDREIEGYSKAISKTKREIVFSTSPGATDLNFGNHISKYADMWRISPDFWDDWSYLYRNFELLRNWSVYRTEGCYPDGDMIPFGKLSKRGPMKEERYSNFTLDEQKTLMSLWCLSQSPLMYGGNMVENTQQELDLMTNRELLAISQNSCRNREIFFEEGLSVWYAEDRDGKYAYLGFFNTNDQAVSRSYYLSQAGLKADTLYDIWSGEEQTAESNTVVVALKPHACQVYRVELK